MEINKAQILEQTKDHWQTIAAMLVHKYAKGHAVLTMEDMVDYPVEKVLLTHGHPDAIEFKLLPREEAEKTVAEVEARGGYSANIL